MHLARLWRYCIDTETTPAAGNSLVHPAAIWQRIQKYPLQIQHKKKKINQLNLSEIQQQKNKSKHYCVSHNNLMIEHMIVQQSHALVFECHYIGIWSWFCHSGDIVCVLYGRVVSFSCGPHLCSIWWSPAGPVTWVLPRSASPPHLHCTSLVSLSLPLVFCTPSAASLALFHLLPSAAFLPPRFHLHLIPSLGFVRI